MLFFNNIIINKDKNNGDKCHLINFREKIIQGIIIKVYSIMNLEWNLIEK